MGDASMSVIDQLSSMATLTHVSTSTTQATVVAIGLFGGVVLAAMLVLASSVNQEPRPQSRSGGYVVPIVEEARSSPLPNDPS